MLEVPEEFNYEAYQAERQRQYDMAKPAAKFIEQYENGLITVGELGLELIKLDALTENK